MKKKDNDPCWDSHKMVGMKKKGNRMVPNCVPKESKTFSSFRQVSELKKSTLASYIGKASHDVATKSALTRHFATKSQSEKDKENFVQARKDDETSNKMFAKSWKRRQGIQKAANKLAGGVKIESVEDMDEGYVKSSNKKLKRANIGAMGSASGAQATGDTWQQKRDSLLRAGRAKLKEAAKNKVVVKTNEPVGYRISDVGPGGKEHNVKTDKAWDKKMKKEDVVGEALKGSRADPVLRAAFKKAIEKAKQKKQQAAATSVKEEEQVNENLRLLAQKGIGAERKGDIKVGHGVDYYHPKDGSKHMGTIHSMTDKGYTVKDDKTGDKHTFSYYKRMDEAAKWRSSSAAKPDPDNDWDRSSKSTGGMRASSDTRGDTGGEYDHSSLQNRRKAQVVAKTGKTTKASNTSLKNRIRANMAKKQNKPNLPEEFEQMGENNLGLRGLVSTNPQSMPNYAYKTQKGKEKAAKKNVPALKSAIKDILGKHPKPRLPEEVEQMEEGTGVTDYNPKSQGGTRKELIAKYRKTKNPEHAAAARRAGATQKELMSASMGEAAYMGKGNHKPGWMLRADPELAKKFKEIEDRKKAQAKYAGKLVRDGKVVKEEELGERTTVKNLKRILQGKDITSRVAQELTRAGDAAEKDPKKAKKHYRRYDKLVAVGENVKQIDEKGDFWNPDATLDSKMGGRSAAIMQQKTASKKKDDAHLALLKRLAASGKKIAAESKQMDDDPNIPFAGPYRKAGEVKKDKYGNVVKPKNIAKHLAKQGMAAASMKKEAKSFSDFRKDLNENV